MAISIVNSYQLNSFTPPNPSYPEFPINPVAAGNMLVACFVFPTVGGVGWNPALPVPGFPILPGIPSDSDSDLFFEVNGSSASPPAGTFQNNSVDIWYCLNPTPGTNHFYGGGPGAPSDKILTWVLEIHSDSGPFFLDTSGVQTVPNGTTVTTCPGPTLTTINGSQQPIWTQDLAGQYIISAAAFKDSAGNGFLVAVIDCFGNETGVAAPWTDGTPLQGLNIATVITSASTGNIRVVKATIPSGSPQIFTYHPDWEGSFSLSDAQFHLSPNLAPGSYSITEDAVPNWTAATSIDPTAIVVTVGVTTVITFTNTFVSPITPPGPVCYADGIIPSGAIDGVNTLFTLPSAPNPPGSLILESDTSLLAPGAGFNLNFVLSGTQLTLVYPPKTSLVAWYRIICGAGRSIPPLYKLNPDQAFDDNAFTSTPTAINSTYFTYGFVNAAKSQQNPLLGFHRKRFSEIQMNVNGSGQFIVTTFPNYILKKDLSYNPYAYVVPPILLQTDPPDDLIRPLNSVGNRVYVKFETNAVGAAFDISKTILVGVMDSYNIVNPNV